MLQLTDKDLKIMIEVELLLHEKLENTDSKKKDWNLWTRYWNLVEMLCQQKDLLNKMKKERR